MTKLSWSLYPTAPMMTGSPAIGRVRLPLRVPPSRIMLVLFPVPVFPVSRSGRSVFATTLTGMP